MSTYKDLHEVYIYYYQACLQAQGYLSLKATQRLRQSALAKPFYQQHPCDGK